MLLSPSICSKIPLGRKVVRNLQNKTKQSKTKKPTKGHSNGFWIGVLSLFTLLLYERGIVARRIGRLLHVTRFSSRRYLRARESPHALNFIFWKVSQCRLWDRSSLGVINNGATSSFFTADCRALALNKSLFSRWFSDDLGFVPVGSVSSSSTVAMVTINRLRNLRYCFFSLRLCSEIVDVIWVVLEKKRLVEWITRR